MYFDRTQCYKMLNSHRNRLLLSWNQSNFFPCRATSFGKGQRSIWTWARQCVFWLARFTRNGPIRFGLTIHIFTRKMASWYVFVAKWCDQTTFFLPCISLLGGQNVWREPRRSLRSSSMLSAVAIVCFLQSSQKILWHYGTQRWALSTHQHPSVRK